MCKVNPTKRRIRIFTVMFSILAIALFLFTGYRNGRHKDLPPVSPQKGNPEQKGAKMDTMEEDTMATFYERIRRWGMLQGVAGRRNSDK